MNRVSAKRFLFLTLSLVLLILLTSFYSIKSGMLLDRIFSVLIISIAFFLSFILYLLFLRQNKKIYDSSSYLSLFICILVCCLGLITLPFIPAYSFPFILLPFILSLSLDTAASLSLSLFFVLTYATAFSLTDFKLYAYFLSVIIGAFIATFIKGKKRWATLLLGLILFCLNTSVYACFYYLEYGNLPRKNLIFILIPISASAIFVGLLYNYLVAFCDNSRVRTYETVVDENHPMLLDLKNVSTLEYNYAINLANLCGKCADLISCDRMLAMAGGLYFHMENVWPKNERNKYFKRLNDLCFPIELMVLLSEREEGKVISSKEGALVHMTDAVLKKLYALYNKADNTNWNVNMVVYQTLNECQGAGTYDSSGLSMNEFLKVRDYLAGREYKF